MVRPIATLIVLLTACGYAQGASVPASFSYTLSDPTTGSGTITANVDTTAVGGPGVLPFSGSMPLPAITQKGTTTQPLPSGIIGFVSGQSNANPGAPVGVHMGWSGLATLTATSGNNTYEIDVPLLWPSSSVPFTYSADVFDDNSGAGGTNDLTGSSTGASWLGDDLGGHRHTGSSLTWTSGADAGTYSAGSNLGGGGHGDALGSTFGLRGTGSVTLDGSNVVFLDEYTLTGQLLTADDSTVRVFAPLTPEPSSLLLFSACACLLAAYYWRRKAGLAA